MRRQLLRAVPHQFSCGILQETTPLRSPSLLPPSNEVWGKVIFLHLSVILFTWGVGVPAPGGLLPGWSAPRGGLLPGGGA